MKKRLAIRDPGSQQAIKTWMEEKNTNANSRVMNKEAQRIFCVEKLQ